MVRTFPSDVRGAVFPYPETPKTRQSVLKINPNGLTVQTFKSFHARMPTQSLLATCAKSTSLPTLPLANHFFFVQALKEEPFSLGHCSAHLCRMYDIHFEKPFHLQVFTRREFSSLPTDLTDARTLHRKAISSVLLLPPPGNSGIVSLSDPASIFMI